MCGRHRDDAGRSLNLSVNFEWDDRKAESNIDKHGISFDEASESFDDPYAIVIDDPDHSEAEERFVLIGMSMSARVLTVCHCVRDEGSVICIISARKSTRNEERQYWRWLAFAPSPR